jgi:hypothetical protein
MWIQVVKVLINESNKELCTMDITELACFPFRGRPWQTRHPRLIVEDLFKRALDVKPELQCSYAIGILLVKVRESCAISH